MAFVGGLNVVSKSSLMGKSVCAPVVSKSAVVKMGLSGTVKAAPPNLEQFTQLLSGNTYRELRPLDKSADYDALVAAVYRQMFGNSPLLKSQKADLKSIESEFRNRRYSVKEFCRALAKSDVFRSKFFDDRSIASCTETMFLTVLGRNVDTYGELCARMAIYAYKGYDAYVDSFFDDGEYDVSFAEYEVPSYTGAQNDGQSNGYFPLFQIKRKGSVKTAIDRISVQRGGFVPKGTFVNPPARTTGKGAPSGVINFKNSPGSYIEGVTGLGAPEQGLGTKNRAFHIEVSYNKYINNGSAGIKLVKRKSVGTPTFFGPKINGYSRGNLSYVVPFDELHYTYQKIHKAGGVIKSITAV